jgi:two-component system, response regulator PdtaR
MEPNFKIMIVEDEILAAMALRKTLQRRGHGVCNLISSGQEAIQKAGEERPDVVLMDIQLRGEVDGIEAATEIYSRYGIPIVFMTGYPDQDRMDQAKAAQPIGYFIKPVNIDEVINRVKTYLVDQVEG